VTPAEIIYHRRVRLLELAGELGNVSAACRQMGISRTRYYEWRAMVARYGLAALMPKERRVPQLPNATPTHVLEELLTLAVLEPTLGCRQYADRLADRRYEIGKTTVQASRHSRPGPPSAASGPSRRDHGGHHRPVDRGVP
jgi:hypothetical protein